MSITMWLAYVLRSILSSYRISMSLLLQEMLSKKNSMADRYDSYLTSLHKLRQLKGILRQDSYKATLKKLQKELSDKIKESHPYRLIVNETIDQMKPLMEVPEFRNGAIGSPAAHNSEYIYHLTSIRKVAGEPKPKVTPTLNWTHFPPGFSDLTESDRNLFECLIKKYQDVYGGTGWMPLKEFATGKYSVKRGFTWWTNKEFTDADIVCAAHRVGLPNTWIPKYALVMQCLTKKVAGTLSHVPTTLDGFISEIFSPADYRTGQPTCGEAINLDNPKLIPYAEEYSLKPIEVESIYFRPVLIDNRKRRMHVVNRDPRLWQLLENYYDTL
jgi:hypothetical protein